MLTRTTRLCKKRRKIWLRPEIEDTLAATSLAAAQESADTPTEKPLEKPVSRHDMVRSGLYGTIIGFGMGQAVQDRYESIGWVFTVGDTVSLGLVLAGFASCNVNDFGFVSCSQHDTTLMLAGGASFVAFRIGEIVDVWVTPKRHNRRYRELKKETEGQQWSFMVAPNELGGATAMLGYRF